MLEQTINSVTVHKKLEMSEQGSTWFCSDLHGQYGMLMEMLERVGFDFKHDRLIFVGDLIDRGPDSEECLRLLEQFPEQFYSVLGNHELMFLHNRTDHAVRQLHVSAGGEWVDELATPIYQQLSQLIAQKMPVMITVPTRFGTFGVVHAQCPDENWTLACQRELSPELLKACTWNFSAFLGKARQVQDVDAVISGHVGCEKITIKGNQVWTDTLWKTESITLIKDQALADIVNEHDKLPPVSL